MNLPVYRVGSQQVWIFRMMWVSLAATGSLWVSAMILRRYTDTPVLALIIILLCMFVGPLRVGNPLTLLRYLTYDCAYGLVDKDGFHYRVAFRTRFLPWAAVRRLEYSPSQGGALELYRYDMNWTLRFVPTLPSLRGSKNTPLDMGLVTFLRDQLDRPLTRGAFVEIYRDPPIV